MQFFTTMSSASTAYRLPVLKYHGLSPGVLPKGAHPVHISLASFTEQMEWLKSAGYQSVSLSTLRTGAAPRGVNPEKCFAITFDDGFQSQADLAAGVLERLGFTATIFVVTHWLDDVVENPNLTAHKLDSDKFMHWPDVGMLMKIGWQIGSHGVAHLDSTSLNPDRLELEMRYSHDAIKEYTGRAPIAFAYPFGKFDERSLLMARKYYPQAFTGQAGLSSVRQTFRYRQHRIEINSFDDLNSFQRKVTRGFGTSNEQFQSALREQVYRTNNARQVFTKAANVSLKIFIP